MLKTIIHPRNITTKTNETKQNMKKQCCVSFRHTEAVTSYLIQKYLLSK